MCSTDISFRVFILLGVSAPSLYTQRKNGVHPLILYLKRHEFMSRGASVILIQIHRAPEDHYRNDPPGRREFAAYSRNLSGIQRGSFMVR
jgi:hypothetical protein